MKIKKFPTVETIAAVVPVFNEQHQINSCLDALSAQPEITQIIVADGGSTDKTTVLAEQSGALIVTSPMGRGIQIHHGTDHAIADVVQIIHADCQIKPRCASRVINALNRHPEALGGAVGMRFTSENRRKRLLSLLNNLRAKYFGIAFGDQGQFIRRTALDVIGGFPSQYLMEDVEFSLRIKEAGEQVFIPDGIDVSGRRWDRAFVPGVVKVLRLFSLYLVERRLGTLDPTALRYYKQYYGNEATADNRIAARASHERSGSFQGGER